MTTLLRNFDSKTARIFLVLLLTFSAGVLSSRLNAQSINLKRDGFDQLLIMSEIAENEYLPLIEAWAASTFRNGFNVSANGNILVVETTRRNAFYYTNLGETFKYSVGIRFKFDTNKKTLDLSITSFLDGANPSRFNLNSIFTKNNVPNDDMKEAVSNFEKDINKVVKRLPFKVENKRS